MNLVGLVLIIAGVYGAYCGVESFNPLGLLKAIISDPSNVNATIQAAKAYRDQTKAPADDSSTSTAGESSTPPAADYGLGIVAGAGATAPASGSLGSFEAANRSVLGGTGSSAADIQVYQQYADLVLADTYHITDAADQQALVKLWNQESGWNPTARNPGSGAYGIPQFLPTTGNSAGTSKPGSSAQSEINAGLAYIVGKYKTPSDALAFEFSRSPTKTTNWY